MIGAIVVLYNPNMDEIIHIKDYFFKVDYTYIIDNSEKSNLESIVEILNVSNKQIEYMHFPENIGLCTALNKGMRETTRRGCEWTLIMDADSAFINDILSIYSKQINKNILNVGIYAPVHIHDRSTKKKYIGIKEIEWSMTSGCMFNNAIFNIIGGFMEDLFVDGLDIDYCYRLNEQGYKIIECGEALLSHRPAKTEMLKVFGKCILKYGVASPWRYYMQARSCVWLFLRYKKKDDLIRYIWRWFKVIFLFQEKREYSAQMRSGTLAGICMYKKYRKET